MRIVCLLALAWTLSATDLRLLDAVKRRDARAFDALLAQRADIDATAPDGATALAWASFLGLSDMAGKLIATGAKVNSANDYGETPLLLALANGDAELADKLINAGADPKPARWNGETPLMIAAGAGGIQNVRLLLRHGADVNALDPKRKQTALMWAAAEGHAEVVDLLLRSGADVHALSKSGFSPIVFAAMKDDAPSVIRLLQAGADANFALPDQTKILTIATANRGHNAALALLDGGADPNVVDKLAGTPLHAAAQAGVLELVKKLLAKGANPNVRNGPVQAMGFRTVAGEQTPLLLAARANRVDIMRALIEAGADTKLKAQDGASLLIVASASGRVAAAKYAFEFDKDVLASDKNGLTPMHASVSSPGGGATQAEMVELVQFLADIGVPMDEKDGRGRTPIQTGDGIPLDKPIQRMADIIVRRGATPHYFPKEYVRPGAVQPIP